MYPQYLVEDLANSGLEPLDVRARIAGPNEKQATNTPMGVNAYVLPYYDMQGKALPFYRAKLIDSPDPKVRYKQLATSSNHVYFPLGVSALLRTAQYVILTEGEKKAAAAVKAGFPCVALGGVDSWRNRTVVLHKDSKVGTTPSGQVVAKLPPGSEISERIDTLANGMSELIDFLIKRDIPIVICYDAEPHFKERVRFEVQRAAATLGFELRHRGVPFTNIRQLHLNPKDVELGEKFGLDDFLVNEFLGPDALQTQLNQVLSARSAFPVHPNTREYVNRKLQKSQIPRSEMQAISLAVICDLDSKGRRLHCPDDDTSYYFDEKNYRLIKARFTNQMDFSTTPFGVKLYNDYGITSADQRVLAVLNAQFCGEQPLQTVKPEKVMTVRGDALFYQLSDGLMAKVTAEEIKILHNGSEDVLFESDLVKPIPHKQLLEVIQMYKASPKLNPLWYPVLQDARIKESPNDNSRRLLTLLYSISPWLYQWRSTQLPIEQMLGEAGSGKSTLYSLRQQIMMGEVRLRNAPRDIKDWTASVAATGGLHVTDNVHMSNHGLKQQLSDEICRVITESNPHIEARKLYTDNDLIRVPVKTVFAVTAIKLPFSNVDILQRSIITELDKGTDLVEYEAGWEGVQLQRFGGRTQWVAHQLVFLQRLFQRIQAEWDYKYRAKFRLINVEQLLIMAAKVYGWDHEWIPGFLEAARDERTAKSDTALEGLCRWADYIREHHKPYDLYRRGFTSLDMVAYFEAEDEWHKNTVLTNARSLGSYIADRKNTMATIAGIVITDRKHHNRVVYKVEPRDKLPTDQ